MKFSGGGLELGDPMEIGGEVLDFASAIAFSKLLFVVVEAGGKATLGVFVHGVGANLKFEDFFVGSDNGGVEGLVAVLFRDGDIVFDATGKRGVEVMDDAEGEIAGGDIIDDDAKSGKVIDSVDVLVELGEFFMERINGFNAAANFEMEFFGREGGCDFFFDFKEIFGGGAISGFDQIF